MRLKRPARLWILLLVSNLAVLALPLTGLWAMRLYESALIRQTESELVARGAVLTASFREELRRAVPASVPAAAAAPFTAAALSLASRPGLDLADDPVLPPEPDPEPAARPAGARAQAVGQALAPVLRDAQAVTLAAVRLTDAHGVVVAGTGSDLGLSLARWDEVARVLAGAPISTAMHRREELPTVPGGLSRTAGLRVFVALPVLDASGVAGAVVLSRTPRDVGQAVWGKRYPLAALASLLLAAGTVLALGLSRLVTRPLALVVAQAQIVASGGDIVPLRRPGTREVAELSAALIQMAATLDRRARYITAFAASVSHEFKTPLTALRGAAELMEDHGATLLPAERARLLGIISGSTARLDRLVRRLLDLARADMMRAGGTSATRLRPVLAGLAQTYRQRGMTVEFETGDGVPNGAAVALPSDALEALLASLLDNAAAYAGPSPCVTVAVLSEGGRVVIVLNDDGPGISAANRPRIFEPFFTTAREAGGTGLGLPIARAIATGAGGTVELVPTGRGACFRVVLPAATADAVSDREF